MRVPEAAANRPATLHLTFPDFPGPPVRPTTLTLPVVLKAKAAE